MQVLIPLQAGIAVHLTKIIIGSTREPLTNLRYERHSRSALFMVSIMWYVRVSGSINELVTFKSCYINQFSAKFACQYTNKIMIPDIIFSFEIFYVRANMAMCTITRRQFIYTSQRFPDVLSFERIVMVAFQFFVFFSK